MKQGEKNRGEKSWMQEKSDEKNVRKKLKSKLLMQVGLTYSLLPFTDVSIPSTCFFKLCFHYIWVFLKSMDSYHFFS